MYNSYSLYYDELIFIAQYGDCEKRNLLVCECCFSITASTHH